MATTASKIASSGLEAQAESVGPHPELPDQDFPTLEPGQVTDWSRGIDGSVGRFAGSEALSGTRRPPGRIDLSNRLRGQVVVLLPALNEEPSIGTVIDRIPVDGLRASGYDVAVWVVDGQSSDRTMDVAREKGASTFVQSGTGKGNGVRQALNHLLVSTRPAGMYGDRLFIMLDADGTYPAGAIPRFVKALESGEDVVLGSRLQGFIEKGAISGLNLLGNHLLTALARLLFRVPVSDVCSGMWGFREDALKEFGLIAEGFDLEADLFASACERGVRLGELPISYSRRIGEAKLVPLRTGLAVAWRLLMRRLNRPSAGSNGIRPLPAANREETA